MNENWMKLNQRNHKYSSLKRVREKEGGFLLSPPTFSYLVFR